MYAKTAALILGAMAAVGSTSPVASNPEAKSVLNARDNAAAAANSTAPGKYHTAVTEATTHGAQADTNLYVCTDLNFGGQCQNLRTTKGMQALLAPSGMMPAAVALLCAGLLNLASTTYVTLASTIVLALTAATRQTPNKVSRKEMLDAYQWFYANEKGDMD
ncbi:MAG: hypothetical protein Q9226_008786 [Calogaya cf. arnoldii]